MGIPPPDGARKYQQHKRSQQENSVAFHIHGLHSYTSRIASDELVLILNIIGIQNSKRIFLA
jgi:hypothetical protein